MCSRLEIPVNYYYIQMTWELLSLFSITYIYLIQLLLLKKELLSKLLCSRIACIVLKLYKPSLNELLILVDDDIKVALVSISVINRMELLCYS